MIFRFIISLLAMTLCAVSCSEKEDEGEGEDTISSNAVGIIVSWNSNEVMQETRYYWIDNYTLKFSHTESYIKKQNYFPNTKEVYKPFTMDLVYADLSNRFKEPITDDTDFSLFEPNPCKYINYMKTQLGRYEFVCFSYGDVCLFNRTNNN
ncbi:hypothetical protein [Bacteroides sp.]|uniref:hypothetical protein n=1 Tax=Bacteroides sp. TaxID=29523 RepID=UPI003AB2DD48